MFNGSISPPQDRPLTTCRPCVMAARWSTPQPPLCEPSETAPSFHPARCRQINPEQTEAGGPINGVPAAASCVKSLYRLCRDLGFWIDVVNCTVPCGESCHHGVLVKQYTNIKTKRLFLACPHSAVNISKYCRREMLLKLEPSPCSATYNSNDSTEQ